MLINVKSKCVSSDNSHTLSDLPIYAPDINPLCKPVSGAWFTLVFFRLINIRNL